MRRISLAVLALLMLPASAVAQEDSVECDCTILPYRPDPPCYDICGPEILARAATDGLVEILGLPRSTAERITALGPEEHPNTLLGYTELVGGENVEELRTRLRGLEQADLRRLLADDADPLPVIKVICPDWEG